MPSIMFRRNYYLLYYKYSGETNSNAILRMAGLRPKSFKSLIFLLLHYNVYFAQKMGYFD